MDHLAIDLGGRESQVCVRRADGEIVKEQKVSTATLPAYLAKRPHSRVIVETCSEAFWVADAAQAAGHEVRVVPGTLVRTLGIGARRLKTDRRDAQVLSEVSCRIDLPSVHVPAAVSRQLKTQCGMREATVRARTQVVNTVRGWLRAEGRRLPRGSVETFPARVRTLLGETPLPPYVARQLRTIDALTVEIREADQELAGAAHAHPVAPRLMTVPGVGPVTAMRFLAALDDPTRFAGAHAVEAYLGLVPGQHSSSDRTRHLGITKAGSPEVRWCLVQAAWVARRTMRPCPLRDWVEAVERRRGKAVAIMALARKLAGILFALWRDGSRYDPLHACCPPPRDRTA